MKTYFFSDLHLKNDEDRPSQIFAGYLESLAANSSRGRLCLLGDIFDFWLADHSLFLRRHQRVVTAILNLKKLNWEILYFEGNHDLHIHWFWRHRYGITVYNSAQYLNFEGVIFRLEHGDLINLNDKSYLKFRGFVRHGLIRPLAKILPGRFWRSIGDGLSRKSREAGSRRPIAASELRTMIREHAERSFLERPFDVIVTGHMHVQDDVEIFVKGRQTRSINLGSWFEGPHVTIWEAGIFQTHSLPN